MKANPTEEFCFVFKYALGLFPFFLFLTRIGLGVDLIGTQLLGTETLVDNGGRKYVKQSNRMFRSHWQHWSSSPTEKHSGTILSTEPHQEFGESRSSLIGTIGSSNETREFLSRA